MVLTDVILIQAYLIKNSKTIKESSHSLEETLESIVDDNKLEDFLVELFEESEKSVKCCSIM